MRTQFDCPPVDDYLQMLAGKLSDEQLDTLARHLESCESCPQTLAGLGDDTLVEMLRRTNRDNDRDPKPLTELIERFRQVRSDPMAATGSIGSDTPSLDAKPAAKVDLGFLTPAQSADELGRLNGYRVLRVLGVGGMGVVLEAEDMKLKRRVALKVMRPEIAANATAKDRFLREAQSAAALTHDHVVTIYQVGEDNGVPFIALQFLNGETLADRLKRDGALPAAEVVRIGKEIATGLAAAHEQGLIHRDIKPANIWLEENRLAATHRVSEAERVSGRVKILDFGLARLTGDTGQLTQSGAILGTPAYMAPEQARGKKLDGRADLFSLGVVMYEALTGLRPFTGPDTMSILSSLALDHPPAPHELNAEIPVELSNLVMKLLEKDPQKRIVSAHEVVASLRRLLPDNTVVIVAPKPTEANPWTDIDVEAPAPKPVPKQAEPKAKPTTPRKRIPLIAIAIASCFLALGLGYGLYEIIFKTKDGTLIVEVDDDAVVRFRKGKLEVLSEDGTTKYTLEPGNNKKSDTPPGKYTVRVVGADGVKLDTPEFTMEKNGKVTLRVRAVSPQVALTPSPNDNSQSNTERRVAAWVLQKGGELWIREPNGATRMVKALPESPFVVARIDLRGENGQFPVKEVIDNLAQLTSLTHVTLGYMPLTDADFETIAKSQCMNNVISLELIQTRVTDEGLAHVSHMENLLALNLFPNVNGPYLTDAGLRRIATAPKLDALRVDHSRITAEGLAEFGQRPIRTLTLQRNQKFGVEEAAGIASFSNLVQLDLSHTPVDDAGIAQLTVRVILEDLILYSTKVTDRGLADVAKFTKLRHLDLGTSDVTNGGRITDAGLAKLKPLINLEILGLNGLGITDAGLANLVGFGKLNILSIAYTGITDAAIPHLAKLPQLKQLNADHTKLSAEGVKKLVAALPNCKIMSDHGTHEPKSDAERVVAEWVIRNGGLVELVAGERYLGSVKSGGVLPAEPFQVYAIEFRAGTAVDDAALDSFAELRGMVRLWLWNSSVTDPGFARFLASPAATNLIELSIVDDRIGDAGLEPLSKLRRLTHVTIVGSKFTDATLLRLSDAPLTFVDFRTDMTGDGLAALKGKKLTTLRVGGARMGDESMRHLKDTTTLENLYLSYSGVGDAGLAHLTANADLAVLHLNECKATAAGLDHVARFRKLVVLSLFGLPIEDADLPKLTVLTALKELNIARTKVSADGVKKLAAKLAKCRITWDGGVIEPRVPAHIRGDWRVAGDVIEHPTKDKRAMLLFGSPEFGDGDYSAEIMREATGHGVALVARATDLENYYYFEVGSFNNQFHSAYSKEAGTNWRRIDQKKAAPVAGDRWIPVRLKMRGDSFEFYVDNQLVLSGKDSKRMKGYIGVRTWNESGKCRNLKFTSPDGKVLWEGLPVIASDVDSDRRAAEWVLSVGGGVQIRVDGKPVDLEPKTPIPAGSIQLVGVDMRRSKAINDDTMRQFRGLAHLQQLSLNATSVGDAGLVHLRGLKSLAKLDLYSTQVTDAGLVHLTEIGALTDLSLTYVPITDAGLKVLAECKNLTKLHLTGTHVTNAGLSHLRNLKLHFLGLGETRVTDAGLIHLKGHDAVDLSHTRVSDAGLVDLAQIGGGKAALTLRATRITDKGHKTLVNAMRPGGSTTWTYGNIITEEVLRVGGTLWLRQPDGKPDRMVKTIAELPPPGTYEARKLSLAESKDPATGIIRDGLGHIVSVELARVEVLDLSGRVIDGFGPDNRSQLRELVLDNVELKDAAIAQLAKFDKVKRISLGDLAVKNLRILKSLPQVEELALPRSAIDDDGLLHLKGFTKLKKLDLSGTQVRGTGFVQLKEMPTLTDLTLDRSAISELFLDNLAQLKQLKRISLAETKVGEQALKKLKTAMPNCEISK